MRSVATWRFVVACNAIAALAILSTFFVNCRGERAFADNGTAIMAARSLIGEAGYRSRADHVAILRVYDARHRLPAWRDRPMRDLIEHYSAPVRPGLPANTNRDRVLAIVPSTVPPAIADLVRRWIDGEDIGDPCHGATHFGSPSDAARSRMARVQCSSRTLNVFLRERVQ